MLFTLHFFDRAETVLWETAEIKINNGCFQLEKTAENDILLYCFSALELKEDLYQAPEIR